MKTTKVLTITKLYDFELTPWEAHGSQFVTITGEAIGDDGKTYCWTNNAKADNEERRVADFANLIECEAQFFVHDEGKATGKGMPKLKITGYPNGPGDDSEGLTVLSGTVGTRTVSGTGSIPPPAQTGRPAAAVVAGGSLSPAPAHTALIAAAIYFANSENQLEDDVLLLAGRWERWLVGEKTDPGAGGEREAPSAADEVPAPKSSDWGDDAAAAPPQSDPLSEEDEMWDLAMSEFGAGSRAPVKVALRQMLGKPVAEDKVTVQELADVIVWRQSHP